MTKKRMLLTCILLVLFLPSLTASNQNSALGHKEENEYEKLRDMPLETVISRRMSIHYGNYYDLNATVSWELVSKVLWATYGYSWRGRTVASLSGHPVIIYVCNESAAYKFVPENQSLTLLKEGDYRELGGAYPAPIQLFISVDTNICQNVTWGNAESGCVIQSIYLMANALNLGTVCTNDVLGVHQGLSLPENEKVLYKMPLGYPLPPYTDYQNLVPTSRPSSPELPEIQDSCLSIEDALNSVLSSHEWSQNPITKQELSQVLWASYGCSYYEDTASTPPKRHRTVPSAHAYYPMRIYAANSSGVYEYLPEQHTLTTIIAEDRRTSIAQASGNTWASSAPLIIAIAWDDSHILTVDTTYIEIGLITQNVYLESAAWGLIADWGKADTDEEAMRNALGLTGENHLHPASIITVGHPTTYLHKAEWNETIYVVETKTNSTVLNFTFDQPNRKITFNASAPSGTTGFCNVTIPNMLLWGDFTVLINGTPPTSLTRKDNATHTSLYFAYKLLSSLNVQIIGEHVIPEFQTWIYILLMFSMFAFVATYKLRPARRTCARMKKQY